MYYTTLTQRQTINNFNFIFFYKYNISLTTKLKKKMIIQQQASVVWIIICLFFISHTHSGVISYSQQ